MDAILVALKVADLAEAMVRFSQVVSKVGYLGEEKVTVLAYDSAAV